MALAALGVAGAAACGSSSADIGPYTGTWQRIEAGSPNPGFTLTIVPQDGAAVLTFANHADGTSQTVAGETHEDYVACTVRAGDDPTLDAAGPGSPSPGEATEPWAQANLQLSLDETGQLVVDLVLPDGTLAPVWIYERVGEGNSE